MQATNFTGNSFPAARNTPFTYGDYYNSLGMLTLTSIGVAYISYRITGFLHQSNAKLFGIQEKQKTIKDYHYSNFIHKLVCLPSVLMTACVGATMLLNKDPFDFMKEPSGLLTIYGTVIYGNYLAKNKANDQVEDQSKKLTTKDVVLLEGALYLEIYLISKVLEKIAISAFQSYSFS